MKDSNNQIDIILNKIPLLFSTILISSYFYFMFIFHSTPDDSFSYTKLYYYITYFLSVTSFLLGVFSNAGDITKAKIYNLLSLKNLIKGSKDDMIDEIHNKLNLLEEKLEANSNKLSKSLLNKVNLEEPLLKHHHDHDSNIDIDYNETGTDMFIIINDRQVNKSLRFCTLCLIIKPDRSHHCKDCNKCIFKCDHHCPWMDNCIGLYNMKYFILFLFYSNLSLTNFTIEKYSYFLLETVVFKAIFVVYLMLNFLLLILFGFNLYLISINKTNYEYANQTRVNEIDERSLYKKQKKTLTSTVNYSHGVMCNLKEVLGDWVLLWIVPVKFNSDDDYGCGVDIVFNDMFNKKNKY